MGTNLHQDLLLVERSCQMLGTPVSIQLVVPTVEVPRACTAIEVCLTWLKEVGHRLSRSDPASELCQLHAATGQWQPVSNLLLTAVQEALRESRASDGLFDPTLGSHLEGSGSNGEFSPPAGRWREVQLDPKQRQIYLPPGIQLDLKSIAKGWAADVMGNQFLRPFANVLVKVGEDLVLRGRKTRYELWADGVRTSKPQPLASPPPDRAAITLRQGGLATEGASRSEWYHQSQGQHVLDPQPEHSPPFWNAPDVAAPDETGSTPRIATVTALARTAAHAEVAALMAVRRGYPAALQVVESAWRDDKASRPHLHADRDVALLLVMDNGAVILSENMEAYLELYAGGDIR